MLSPAGALNFKTSFPSMLYTLIVALAWLSTCSAPLKEITLNSTLERGRINFIGITSSLLEESSAADELLARLEEDATADELIATRLEEDAVTDELLTLLEDDAIDELLATDELLARLEEDTAADELLVALMLEEDTAADELLARLEEDATADEDTAADELGDTEPLGESSCDNFRYESSSHPVPPPASVRNFASYILSPNGKFNDFHFLKCSVTEIVPHLRNVLRTLKTCVNVWFPSIEGLLTLSLLIIS